MSIQKKTIEVPAKTCEVTASITCDLCGKVYPRAREDCDSIDWATSYGDALKTGVFLATGYGYGDCGNINSRVYHVCPECFEKKLEPWLKEQGATFTTKEIDW